MNSKRFPKLALAMLAATAMLLNASTSHAATITFHVAVETGPLAGSAAAPFALDFQLIGGDAVGNAAIISNVTFGGGAATDAPPPTVVGLARGTLDSTVTLNNNQLSFFNEFLQGFAPGSRLGFDVSLTSNVSTPFPDAFSFAILNSSLLNVPTTGLGDALLLVNLDRATPIVQTFAGTGAFSGITASATTVPEPASMLLIGAGLIGVGVRRWRSGAAVHRMRWEPYP